eukprot:249341_1
MSSSLCCKKPNASLSMIGGEKGIGFWSGCQLLINNMVGPALVLIPALFQKYGYMPVLSMLLVACLLSFFCGIMLTHVIANIQSSPNRTVATKRPEMNHIIDFYFSSRVHLKRVIMIVYISSLVLTLVSNIIQSAQIVDLAIRDIFGCSYALELYPSIGHWICGAEHSDVTPFGPDIYVISIGFLILASVCGVLYITNYNLEDNIHLQWLANIGVVLLSAVWLTIFFDQDTFDVSRIGMLHANDELNVDCVGIILFNFAFIVTIPSWYNEKEPSASVMKSLLFSISFVAVLFCVIGIIGAMSFNYEDLSNDNQSLFTVIDDFGGRMGQISVYLYPIIQNITSIPVFCIIIRYNLQNSGLTKYGANFISIIVPWLLCIPLFTGSGFTNLCDFTGIVLASLVNFILPPYLYLLSIKLHATDFAHGFKDGMIALSAIDIDNDDDDDGVSQKHSTPNVLDVVAGDEDDAIDDDNDDDELTEQIGLIDSDNDIDITKKNAVRCTWDVTVAIICIVVSTVLSLVVITEKLYMLLNR